MFPRSRLVRKTIPFCRCLFRSLPWSAIAVMLLVSSSASGPPSIQVNLSENTLDPYLLPVKKLSYSISRYNPRLLKRRRQFKKVNIRLKGDGSHTFVFQRTLGDHEVGPPIVLSLRDFAMYKFRSDLPRMAKRRLGEKVRARAGEGGGGLVNIKIPVKVPRGLSAITGEGETNIKITGSRRIDLSGQNQSIAGQAQTARARTAQGFTINFQQESQLNVQGTIGDRITLNLQQDSRGQVDIGESLKLRYDGDEDGIIQEIEAGSTSLSLPGTRLIGFSSPNRGGLFGIKGKGRLGGLDVTVVTTQDKGASNRKTFQGQAEETANIIRDFEYEEDLYFFLDGIYRDAYPNSPAGQDLVDINSVRVFLNDFNDINDIEQRAGAGVAFAIWNSDGTPNESVSQSQNGGIEEGSFHELDRDEFLVDSRGYLIMSRGKVNRGFALGVAYQTSDGRTFGDPNFIQDPSNPDIKIPLKLIKGRQQLPDFPTWELSWRNVYSLRGRDIEPEGFELEIFRDVSGQEPVDNQGGTPFLQIFGLDTHTNGSSESSQPDNIIDIKGGNELPGLNLIQGHLVFPDLEPFGLQGVGADDLEDDARVPEIYDTINRTTRSEKSRFFMRIRSKSQSTEFNLGFGIIEDSEEVILNNRRLTKGRDYSIDYQFGSIRLIGDAAELASDPSANLIINYGSKGLFGIGGGGQKSLLGIRAEHPFKDNVSMIGASLLYSSQSATTQRVRVGEEPARTMIWDVNGRFRFKPKLLTSLVNTLPFVTTDAPSSLNLDMEIAQSLPNPNTKNVAYIDDFEGAENRLGIQTFKFVWNQSSRPTRDNIDLSLPKGRLTWYNPVERDRITIYDIQPSRDDIPVEQSVVDILTFRFEPARTNGFPIISRNASGEMPLQSWAGITSYLVGLDFSRSKFIELWVRGNGGKLHLDFGQISERADLLLDHPDHRPPAGEFRTEDLPLPGFPTGDDVATPEEDVGLDGLSDAQEDSVFRAIFPFRSVPDDPSGDNFFDVDFNQDEAEFRYPVGVNGTQNNNPEREQAPDTEDLNRNGILDTRNSYVRYSVDLRYDPTDVTRSDRGLDPTSRDYTGPSVLVVGSQSDPSDNPWRLLRIPLRGQKAPRTVEGSPDTTFSGVIDYARIWIEHDEPTQLDIYTIDIVGSDWLEDEPAIGQQSGDFKVATIGTDNVVYEPPPGLERETDPTTGRELLERSLALKFEDLYPGESVSASRTFFSGQNYTAYGSMTMFAHGGNPASEISDVNFPASPDSLGGILSPVELFIRFAPISEDTLNFYEYRKRIYRGWADPANTMDINLELLSQLKGQLLDRANQSSSDSVAISLEVGDLVARLIREENRMEVDLDGATYTVRGNPALSNIKSFTIGVRNRGDFKLEGENEIWIDELRVDKIRKRKAISALINVQTVLADLGNVSINLERRSGDFQDLQGRATGNTTTQISLDSQLNLNKFLPDAWNTNLPARFSYNRNSSVPRIRRGSDIVLTQQQKSNESDIRSSSRFNISLRKRPATENSRFIAKIFFDRINTSLNYTTNSSVNGAITRRRSSETQNLNGAFSYDLNWPQKDGFLPFKWLPFYQTLKDVEIFYLPSSIRYNARFARNTRDQRSFSAVAGVSPDTIANLNETFTLSETYSLKLAPLRSLNTDYTLSVNRDMRNSFAPTQFQFGRETNRNQQVSFNFTPRLTRWFTVNTQYSANYREQFETGGQRTTYGNARRGLTVGNTNRISGRFSFNLPALFQPLARGRKEGFSIVQLIGKLGSSLQTVQLNAFRNRAFNLFGLRDRPSLKFQLGLIDTTAVEVFNTAGVTRINTRVITDNASANSGIRLPAGFQTSTAASYNHSRNFGNANTEEEKVEFPSVSAGWRGMEGLPVFRWFFTSSSINFTYKESKTKRGDGGLGDLFLTNDSKQTAFSPLFAWQARWKNQMSTSVQIRKTRNNDLRYQRNVGTDTTNVEPTLQERLIGTTITEQSQLNATLRYALSSKFFKKLQSNLDFTMEFGTGTNLQKEIPRSAALTDSVQAVIRRNEDTWRASLAAQYQFSSKFTGGTQLRHDSRKDKLRDLTNRVWEFRVWGEIRFN